MAKMQSDIAIDVEALSRKYQEERDLRLRPEANDQFREVTGSFAHFARDRHADPDFTREAIVEDRDVVIIGGGFGGLLAGARLREQGVASLRIVERGADFGGTWYWNRYPGAACDVESYIYMPMLEETGYLPSRKYARAPEIQAHCRRLAEHFDLYREALLQTEIEELDWDEQRERWIVTTSRGDRIAARFVLSCAGPQSKPRLPGVPGIESFAGQTFHSSRWDYDYSGGEDDGRLTGLADKRVAVIGTGATAVQIIPQVAAWAKQLYVFQRTPSSVDERNDRLTEPEFAASLEPGWQRKRMANFTILTAGGYQDEDLVGDGWTEITRAIMPRPSPDGSPVEVDPEALRLSEMRKMEQARRRIDNLVENKATAEALKPWYHYFCKRPCFHDEYLQAFNRPNVTLVDTRGKGVERITPSGVVVDGVTYDVDCLIYATGFEVLTGYSRETGVEVHGRDGRALSDHWGKGLRTLHGIHTHGFPNFMLLGRLQSGFSGNYVHVADEQARHMAHIVGQCLRDGIATVETSASAEAAWVDIILASGQRRAFLESCTPSYFNYEGQRPAGAENDDVYPGGAEAYIRLLEDWRAEGSMAGLDQR